MKKLKKFFVADRNENIKIFSWAMYDWANSSFATTIMAGFFPIFFKTYWSKGFSDVDTTSKLGTAIGISSFIIAIITPTLAAVADLKNSKKFFLAFFMFFGVLGCILLSFINAGEWISAILCYGIGMIGFSASCVFYDSLLPFISSKKNMDFVSSLGYSLGYLGGALLFLINVIMYLKPELFSIESGVQAVKYSFLSVGVWWLVFSIPLFLFVKEPQVNASSHSSFLKITKESYRSLKATLLEIKNDKNLFLFMIAFWLYIDGVYTVMTMAVDFGIALKFQPKDLITALLLTQFIGFPSSIIFGKIATRFGGKIPIIFCILVYSLAVILSTMMTNVSQFLILATVIGLVQGGVQSLSRSMFVKMIHPEKSSEYFSFLNIVGKFASILGPFLVAITVNVFGSAKYGLTGLLILFILGILILSKVKENKYN